MKKLMMTLGFAALCGAVLPVHAEIESDTVGYNKTTLAAETWYLVAPQFKDVDATGDTVDLLTAVSFSGLQAVPFSSRGTGAQIQVYNPSTKGYTIYYYINDSKDGTAWARTKNNVPTSIPVTLGEGFWLKVGAIDEGGATITVAGSVKSEASKTINVGSDGTWQIACNPYPVALDWGSVTTAGLVAAPFSERNTNAPQIQVYNASTKGYTIYYYINDSKDGTAWARTKNNVASGTMAEVGQAFWVKAPSEGTLTFTFSN